MATTRAGRSTIQLRLSQQSYLHFRMKGSYRFNSGGDCATACFEPPAQTGIQETPMTLSNMPKLVTVFGASGFLGRHIVRVLAKRGYRIRVAVRRPDLAFHLQPLGN